MEGALSPHFLFLSSSSKLGRTGIDSSLPNYSLMFGSGVIKILAGSWVGKSLVESDVSDLLWERGSIRPFLFSKGKRCPQNFLL